MTDSAFTFRYFTSLGSENPDTTTTDVNASDTERNTALISTPVIEVTLNPTKTASGRDITAKASVKTERLNAPH